jgi:hypothetical protein
MRTHGADEQVADRACSGLLGGVLRRRACAQRGHGLFDGHRHGSIMTRAGRWRKRVGETSTTAT